jgi:DNA-binding transcriptional regulator YdaS (Cro superfamily)
MAKKRDMQEVRRASLKVLIAQWGGPTSLAKKLGLSGPSYLSQLLSGLRPITEKCARKTEDALEL